VLRISSNRGRGIRLIFDIPPWLERFLVLPVLWYRLIRYSYAFRRIPLSQGKFAIVDPDDYHRLAGFKWRLCRTKGKNVLYAERSIRLPNGKYSRILMHRQIVGLSKSCVLHDIRNTTSDIRVIDHINGDGLDNRKANLRIATVAQNAWNSKKRNSASGYKGVWFDKNKRLWRAAIVCNRKRIHVGYFKNKLDAANAYDNAARKYHKDFASLNFD
jgi:hypothetical protein